MKSAKIMPATAARSWLFPKISANPLFTLAEKRRFYHPKLPALRAEVDGLAQKSAKPFLLPCRLRLLPPPNPARRRSSSALAVPATLPHGGATSGFLALGVYTARLGCESRTNRRHGRDGAERVAGHSCCASDFFCGLRTGSSCVQSLMYSCTAAGTTFS